MARFKDTGGHRGTGKPTGGGKGSGKTKKAQSAVGATNPAQARALNKLKTGQPTVPHDKAKGSR